MTRNLGVIFTTYVTNSREYNNRITHKKLSEAHLYWTVLTSTVSKMFLNNN